MIVKPCTGEFSSEVQSALMRNHDRSQWQAHPCLTCGRLVEAQQKAGKWFPAQHWPSVRYLAHDRRGIRTKTPRAAAQQPSQDIA